MHKHFTDRDSALEFIKQLNFIELEYVKLYLYNNVWTVIVEYYNA